MRSLVGMFAILNVGHGSYRTGIVADEVSEDHYLMRYDDMDEGKQTMPMDIVCLDEFAARVACEVCGDRAWEFFETRADMLAYLEWAKAKDDTEGKRKGVVTEFPGGTAKPKPH